MEAVICLPVLLLLMLSVGQFAHIWLCRQIVQYAAWSGARATVTASTNRIGGSSEETLAAFHAAKRICSLVSYTQRTTAAELTRDYLPDGFIGGSGGLEGDVTASQNIIRQGKLTVSVSQPDAWTRSVSVQMDVPLLFPFAGQIIGGVIRLWSNNEFNIEEANVENNVFTQQYKEFTDIYYPHIKLRETALSSKPFVVTTSGNLPPNYESWGD